MSFRPPFGTAGKQFIENMISFRIKLFSLLFYQGRSAQIPAFLEKVIVRPEEKKDIFTDTAIFMIKTCIHETHKTPMKSSLIMGFTNSIK